MELIQVKIVNWSKHQPRKDIKHPSWFALSNRIFEDSKLFSLSDSEWKAFIYILCQASQQNSDIVSINLDHAKRVVEISEKSIRSAIEKLTYANVTSTYANVTDALRDTTLHYTTNTTEQTNTPTSAKPDAEFDFDALYKKYPRKEGKQRGIEICKRSIKSVADYDALAFAITRYGEKVARDQLESKYIKQFSSFMATWRDWLDPETGTALGVSGREAEIEAEIQKILGGSM